MDLRQMQYEPQSDLESLKKNIDRGFDDETEQFCKFLARKYDQAICWIKQKEAIENFQLLEKDKLGQMLIPEDIILGEENRFLACKATGNVTVCLTLHHVSWLHFFLRLLTTLELYTNSTFYAKHPAFQEYAGGVENGYDEDTRVLLKGGRRPAAHFTVRDPTARRPAWPVAREIYFYFLRPLQDGGYSTRETGNYQNNTPASQWLGHI